MLLSFTARSALGADATSPQPAGRGGLTFAGLVLGTVGLGILGFAAATTVASGDLTRTIDSYPTPTPAAEAGAVRALVDRHDFLSSMSIVSWISGGAALAGAVTLLILDSPSPVAVSLVPTPQGAHFSWSFRF